MKISLVGKQPLLRPDITLKEGDQELFELDATRLTFVSPLDLGAIVVMARLAAAEGRNVVFHRPANEATNSYIERMDLPRHLRGIAKVVGPKAENVRTDQSHVLLELTRLDDVGEADDVAEKIIPIARRHAPYSVTKAVWSALGELLDNACTHASSDVGVFAAIQSYTGRTSGRRGIEVAVVDGGVGILSHLRNNPKYSGLTKSRSAIKKAIEPGVTGTRDRRGYGFFDVLNAAGAAGLGRLMIRSGDGLGRITAKGQGRWHRFQEVEVDITGTWVWMRIRVP